MNAKSNATTKRPAEPDADAPLSDDDFKRGIGAVLARRVRAATQLSQTAFAERYRIPVASLRDWEQGRRAPDSAALSYLRVIEKMPDAVAAALGDAA